MRKRPSMATVIAIIALFVSLSGTAMAAVLVTKNSQVAAHIIGGANAPSGDNKNLIPGSVGNTDLHSGAVTTSKLSLPKIDFVGPNTDPSISQNHVVLFLDGVTRGVSCSGSTVFYVYASSSAAGASLRGSTLFGAPGSSGTTSVTSLALGSSPTMIFALDSSSGSDLAEGTFIYRDANRVINITLDGVDNGDTHTCSLDGTALPAPN